MSSGSPGGGRDLPAADRGGRAAPAAGPVRPWAASAPRLAGRGHAGRGGRRSTPRWPGGSSASSRPRPGCAAGTSGRSSAACTGRTGPAGPAAGPARTGRPRPTAVQVGATLALPAEREGWYGEFCLLSLARTEAQAALAVAARWAGQTRRLPGHVPGTPPSTRWAPSTTAGSATGPRCGTWASRTDATGGTAISAWTRPRRRARAGWRSARAPRASGYGSTWPRRPERCGSSTEPVPPVSTAARLLDQMGDDLLGLEASGTGRARSWRPGSRRSSRI